MSWSQQLRLSGGGDRSSVIRQASNLFFSAQHVHIHTSHTFLTSPASTFPLSLPLLSPHLLLSEPPFRSRVLTFSQQSNVKQNILKAGVIQNGCVYVANGKKLLSGEECFTLKDEK